MVEERLAPSIRQLKAEAITTIRGIDGTEASCLQIVNMICQPNSLSTLDGESTRSLPTKRMKLHAPLDFNSPTNQTRRVGLPQNGCKRPQMAANIHVWRIRLVALEC